MKDVKTTFYGQFDPPVDKLLYQHYFQDYEKPGFFVECGAFDGITECSCKFFEETMHWSGINIEPSPCIFEQLTKNRPHSTNVNAALSDKNGYSVFNQVIHPEFGELCTNGSLCHTPQHFKLLEDSGCSFKEYKVRTTTWRDLIRDLRIRSVDLLVLDVEGAEHMVIEGMRKCFVLPKILCVEHGHVGGVDAVKKMLDPLGYTYDFSSEANSFFVFSYPLKKYTGILRSSILSGF